MKHIFKVTLFTILAASVAGCASSETPQAGEDVKKQFAGGPMPPDAQKKFQESMRKSHELMQNSQAGGKP